MLLSALLAPIGCISLWRRSTYLSDGLSHAGVLANTISVICLWNVVPLGVFVALALVVLVYWFEGSSDIYVATNIVSSVSIAAAVLIWHLYPASIDVHKILLGNVCCHGGHHGHQHHFEEAKILIWLSLALLTFIAVLFKQLVLISFNRDLAIVFRVRVGIIDLMFLALSAIVINIAVSMIGMFLVSALLILPAAVSKFVSKSPLSHIAYSVVYALVVSFIGDQISRVFHLPIAPTITLLSFGLFTVVYVIFRYLGGFRSA